MWTQCFRYNEEEITEHFSLGNVMEGLNVLYQRLFGIALVNIEPGPGELWHESIYKLVGDSCFILVFYKIYICILEDISLSYDWEIIIWLIVKQFF